MAPGAGRRHGLHLCSDGRLTSEPPSAAEQPEEFTYDPKGPVPTVGGPLLLTDGFRPGPLGQAAVEARENVLIFTTEPLPEDAEVTGHVRALTHRLQATPSPTSHRAHPGHTHLEKAAK
ncbi:CocE/NonD family hydrolase C-terminal non-catalytic domain-containing protein [Streptomyces sp. NPDC051773]|uniref:CocE/NonD family hydrolase C-terminal non-catalytic domain-containing protein n=1 Tax=Streptomyces sp. NPDC051773 TaxID=3156682 RepID=UPI003427639D